jgi:hypothetical protein
MVSAFLDYSPDAPSGYDSHQNHSCDNDQILHTVINTYECVDRNGKTAVPELNYAPCGAGIAPNILTSTLHEGTGRLRALAAFARRKCSPVPTASGAGWTPQPVWRLRRTVTCPAGNQPSISRLCNPKAIGNTA